MFWQTDNYCCAFLIISMKYCVFITFLYLKIDIKNIKVANVTPKYMFLSCKITFLHSMFDIYQFDSYTWSPKI